MDPVAHGGASLLHARHALLGDCGDRTSGATEDGEAHICVLQHRRPDGTVLTGLFMDHGNDAQGSQIAVLRQEWDRFCRMAPDPVTRIVVSEGGQRDVSECDEEDAIARFGEQGLLAWLAQDTGTPIVSGEPERYGLAALEAFFAEQPARADARHPLLTAEHAFYYYEARVIPQYVRKPASERPPFREYMEGFLDKRRAAFAGSAVFAELDFTYEHFVALHNDWYPEHPISLDDDFQPDQALADLLFGATTIDGIDPVPEEERTPVQRMALVINAARDENLANVYRAFLDAGVNVFSVYGYGHAQAVEDALRGS